MRLNRRQFLGAGADTEPCHISSLVVHCQPARMAEAIAAMTALEGVEVPRQDPSGKCVALLELPDQGDILSRISDIEHIPGVISATLVYHQVDD